ncbi:hypothetical protein QJQ45_021235 [Haematococcus lacustris]|nr:hypothetical protein QJQ45_021235 [Haematococcus lacustris]
MLRTHAIRRHALTAAPTAGAATHWNGRVVPAISNRAAAGYLLEADMSQLMRTGGPLLLAFLVGAVGMVMGAVAGLKLCQGLGLLGPHGPQLAACLCASYVGGSVNFAAVAQAVGLPAALVPAAMAADNIAMAVFLALLMVYPEGSSAGHNSVQNGTAASASRTTLPGGLAAVVLDQVALSASD